MGDLLHPDCPIFRSISFWIAIPVSLWDAWGKIDQAFLLFRYGQERMDTLSDEEKGRYRLIGDDLDVTPLSTISDWHVTGIDQLTKLIADRGHHLNQMSPSSPALARATFGKEPLLANGLEDDPHSDQKKGSRAGCWWVGG